MIAIIAIFFICLGGLGGSFQPTRLLILLSGLTFWKRSHFKSNRIGLNPLIQKGLMIYLVWLLYGLFSLLWAPDPSVGLNSEIIVMAVGMSSLLFFPYCFEDEKETIYKLTNSWTISAMATIPLAIYEILTYQHFFYEDEDRMLGGLGWNAPFAATFFGNFNGYSTILCFYFPFMLISFLGSKSKAFKVVTGVSIALVMIIVLINTSRGAMLTLFLVCLFTVKIDVKKILLTVLGIAALYFVLPSSIKTSIETVILYRFSGGNGMQDDSRSGLFKAGVEFLKDSYGFGIGAGGFEDKMRTSQFYSGMINPHNIFIEILSQYGIVIFLLFLYWITMLAFSVWKNKNLIAIEKRILLGSLCSIPIVGAINSAALGYTYWWVYFTTIALIVSVRTPKIKSYEEKLS